MQGGLHLCKKKIISSKHKLSRCTNTKDNFIRYLFVCLHVSQTIDQMVMVGPTTKKLMNE